LHLLASRSIDLEQSQGRLHALKTDNTVHTRL